MDRRPRLSSAQWEQLVGFFEENPQVARGYTRSTQGRQQALRMWEQLALLLNSSGEGVTKDAKSWSKFWNDYKCKLRKKVQEITANMQGTGGGPALEEVLSNIEIRLMAVLGENFGRQLEGVAVDPFAPRNQAPSQSEEVVEMVLLDDPHNPPTLRPGLEVVSVGEEVTLACGGVEEPHTVQPPADQQPTDQPSSSVQRGPSASRGPVRPRRHRQRSGGCQFPVSWTGSWFQSGTPGLIAINSTHIQSKGDCAETDGNDKFLLYDRSEDCYRCLVMHEKHKYVLQYKETFCAQKESLSSTCETITGDAPLVSMFRKEPRPVPQPCPFRPAPFTFVYSRGTDECTNPPSRAESCTDDSRLLLRYQACPDVPGTESNVEELVCLATWKEGSTRYLVGQISQVRRSNLLTSDEDSYRCFIYKGQHSDKTMVYNIAQSADATCNGIFSPIEGSRTMKLTNSDDEHNRCHFPSWIVEHHKWFSLDHSHQYHFTTKNATLKIMNEDGSFEEKRLVCHSILEQKDKKHIKLVAHVTRGCESGHMCLKFHRRDGNVLELQQGASLLESPQDACSDQPHTYITLITTSLPPMRCPILGRYSVVNSLADRRRRRQQITIGEGMEPGGAAECVSGDVHSVSVGCGAAQDTIDFKSACTSTVYTCHGSWWSSGRGYVIAGAVARASTHPRAVCFVYTTTTRNETRGVSQQLSLSVVSRTCDRSIVPGLAGDNAYNLTINGTCEQSSKYNSIASPLLPTAAMLMTSLLLALR